MQTMMKPICMATIGRTGAGKTTLAKWVAGHTDAWLVSEAAIKRSLVEEYKTENSLDEELRDFGYASAAAASACILEKRKNVIVDAAYHLKKRRAILLNASIKKCIGWIWFYCKCDDLAETERRILSRKNATPAYNTQADSMKVYNLIDTLFVEPTINEFINAGPVAIINIQTEINIVKSIDKIGEWTHDFDKTVNECVSIVELHLKRFVNKSGG